MTLKDPSGFRLDYPFKLDTNEDLLVGWSTFGLKTFCVVSAAVYLAFGLQSMLLIMYALCKFRQYFRTFRRKKPKPAKILCMLAVGIWSISRTPYITTVLYAFLFVDIMAYLFPKSKHMFHKETANTLMDIFSQNNAAKSFRNVCQKSSCLFARKARIMASIDWDNSATFARNIENNVGGFKLFLQTIESIGIDGFAFKIPCRYAKNESYLAESVLRIFRMLVVHDPSGHDCLDNNFVHKNGWRFSFDFEPFFVTTFANFYPKTHSRFCEEGTFILFQPERSFYEKKLPEDHGVHDRVLTIRDRIRANFAKHGCPYYVPETPYYPAAHHIIRPIKDEKESFEGKAPGVVKWWAMPDAKSTNHSLDYRKSNIK